MRKVMAGLQGTSAAKFTKRSFSSGLKSRGLRPCNQLVVKTCRRFWFGGSRCSSTADSTEWRSTIEMMEMMEIEKIGERVCTLCWVDWKSCFLLDYLVSRKSSLAWLVCNSHLDLRSRPNHLQLHRKKSNAWFTFWKIGVVHIMLQKIGKMVKAKSWKS